MPYYFALKQHPMQSSAISVGELFGDGKLLQFSLAAADIDTVLQITKWWSKEERPKNNPERAASILSNVNVTTLQLD